MRPITPTQAEVLVFINKHREREQRNPTRLEIAQQFMWSSANAAQDVIRALEIRGVVEIRRAGHYVVRYPFTNAFDVSAPRSLTGHRASA